MISVITPWGEILSESWKRRGEGEGRKMRRQENQ